MKNTILAIMLISVLIAIAYCLNGNQTVSKREFEDFRTEVERRFDITDAELDTVKRNQDTLKLGQKIIYDEIKKTDKSFMDKVFGLFN